MKLKRKNIREAIEICFYGNHNNVKVDDATVDLYIKFINSLGSDIEIEEKKEERHITMARALQLDVNAFRNEAAVSTYLKQISHYEDHIQNLEKDNIIVRLGLDAINKCDENIEKLEEDNLGIARHISKGFADYLRKEKLGHQANRLEEIIERYEDEITKLNKKILGLQGTICGRNGGETLNNIESQVHIDEARKYKSRALTSNLCGRTEEALLWWSEVVRCCFRAIEILKR